MHRVPNGRGRVTLKLSENRSRKFDSEDSLRTGNGNMWGLTLMRGPSTHPNIRCLLWLSNTGPEFFQTPTLALQARLAKASMLDTESEL